MFAPLVVLVRNVMGTPKFNQLRRQAIAIHSKTITTTLRTVFRGGLEKSYPPHKVQVYEKHGAPMDSLKSILAGLLTTAGHLANRSANF